MEENNLIGQEETRSDSADRLKNLDIESIKPPIREDPSTENSSTAQITPNAVQNIVTGIISNCQDHKSQGFIQIEDQQKYIFQHYRTFFKLGLDPRYVNQKKYLLQGKIIEQKSKRKNRRELVNIKILERSYKLNYVCNENVVTKRAVEEQNQITQDIVRDMIFCNLVENNQFEMHYQHKIKVPNELSLSSNKSQIQLTPAQLKIIDKYWPLETLITENVSNKLIDDTQTVFVPNICFENKYQHKQLFSRYICKELAQVPYEIQNDKDSVYIKATKSMQDDFETLSKYICGI